MTIPSMDGGTPSMDESVIRGYHPWMEKPHPRMKMTDMDGAIDMESENK